jgi:xanthine/CO dehydrogenase XdhC/CoxF family maturation factor
MPNQVVLPAVSRVTAAANAGPPIARAFHNRSPISEHLGTDPRPRLQVIARRTHEYFGTGFVTGKVTIEGVPASRQVRLLDGRSTLIIAEVWSTADGRYRFDTINADREYIVLAHDHERQFNAVIADWVRPERRA